MPDDAALAQPPSPLRPANNASVLEEITERADTVWTRDGGKPVKVQTTERRELKGPRGRIAIIDGCRTPFIKSGTDFMNMDNVDLASVAAAELVARTGIDPEEIDLSVFGTVVPALHAPNLGREVVFRTSLPMSIPGVTVIENAPVTGVRAGPPCEVQTTAGSLSADVVVVASHVPVLDRGAHFTRFTQQREYGVAGVLPTGVDPGMTYGVGQPVRSTRTVELDGDRLVVVVGEGHATGRSDDAGERPNRLRGWAQEYLGVTDWRYEWSTQDVFPVDQLPWVGQLAVGQPQVLMASGFSGWGMTNGTAAGLALADRATGRPSRWTTLLDPRRQGVSALPQMLAMNASVAKHLVTGKSRRRPQSDIDALEPGEAVVASVEGRQVAAHRDDAGTIHLVSATCTHLGCTVEWNAQARSWDCPCHGSRFGVDGRVLHGPAVRPLDTMDR